MFRIILLALPLATLLWWLLADLNLRRAGLACRWRIALAAFAVLLLSAYAGTIAARMLGVSRAVPLPVFVVTYIWYLITLPPALCLIILCFVVTSTARALSRRRSAPQASDADTTPDAAAAPVTTRRQLLAAGVISAAPIFVGGASLAAAAQRDTFRLRRVEIPLLELPPPLDGLKIAHLSDIHIGRFTNGPVLRRIVETTNALRADLVVMTGDLIDHALSDLPAGIDLLRKLDARHGVYLCEGNHDLFEDRLTFEQRVRAAGLKLLLDESERLSVRGVALRVIGMKWGGFGRDRRAEDDVALAGSLRLLAAHADLSILLAHHPHAFDAAADAGISLTLAGHTHGGQLMLTPEFGAGPLLFRYWSGLYRRNAAAQPDAALVVSNGVGNWFPLRVNAPAEILELTLRRAT